MLRPHIVDELASQIREDYSVDILENSFVRGVYNGDLQRFKKGIYSYLYESNINEYRKKETEFIEKKLCQKDGHLKESLQHISKARKKQIIIFLDNIDQRPYEFQQDVFLIGQGMAETWPVTLFISIRPDTFYKSKSTGSLSAYHAKAFTVSPPRIDKVIQKRIEYALSLLKQGTIPSLNDINVQLTSLKSYLEILLYSFNNNKEIIEFIDNVCGGNLRLAFDFIKIYIGSGHVNTREILDIYNQSGMYIIALHQLLRAVIHGDYEYFEPNSSEILNVFDLSKNDGKEHFLIPIVLAQMDRWGQTSRDQQYIPQQTLFDFFQNIGFQIHQINFSLRRLLSKKLIESNTKTSKIDNASKFYRITSVGAYYYRKLIKMFSYVDAMVTDTPIVSRIYKTKITDVQTIQKRIDRCKIFISYLSEHWKLIEHQNSPFDWIEVEKALSQDILKIEQRIKEQKLRISTSKEDQSYS